MAGDALKEESVFSSSRVKFEVPKIGSGQLQSDIRAEVESGDRSSSANPATPAAVDKPSHAVETKDRAVKSKGFKANRVKVNNQGSGKDGPSLYDLIGCNPLREYDNNVQQLLAETELKDTDTEDQRELKSRVRHIYSKRRSCLKEEYDELAKTTMEERRIRKRIEELKEARAAGCRTSAEADRYFELKRRMEGAHMALNSQGAFVGSDSVGSNQSPAGQGSSISANDLNVGGHNAAYFLSENEKRLCSEIGIQPSAYLWMQQIISVEIFKGNITSRSDAHRLFQMEPSKVDRVYDMLVKKGIAPA